VTLFYPIHHSSQKEGPHKGGIPFFSEVEFDGHQIVLPDFFFQPRPIHQSIQFVKERFPGTFL
jgi:hypothetical protein